jgi:hypothetical protein
MPYNGVKGILPSFEHPLASTPTYATHYLSIAPGIGILFLVIGIVICLASTGKVAGYAFLGYAVSGIIVAIVSAVFHYGPLDDVMNWIRNLFFIT